jgi:hypothetical protein
VDRAEKNSLTLLNSFFWRNKSFNGKSWYSAKAVCLNSDVSRVEYMPRPVCWLITVSPCLTLGLRSWKSQRRAKQCRAERFSPQELIKIPHLYGCWRPCQLPSEQRSSSHSLATKTFQRESETVKPWATLEGDRLHFTCFYSESPNVWQDSTLT